MRKFYRIMFICLMLVVMSTTAFAGTGAIQNESDDTFNYVSFGIANNRTKSAVLMYYPISYGI